MKIKFRLFFHIELFLNVRMKLIKNKYSKKGKIKKIYSDLVNSSSIIKENKKKPEFCNFLRIKNIKIKRKTKYNLKHEK